MEVDLFPFSTSPDHLCSGALHMTQAGHRGRFRGESWPNQDQSWNFCGITPFFSECCWAEGAESRAIGSTCVEECMWDKGAQKCSLVRWAIPAVPSTQGRQKLQGRRQRRSQLFSSPILLTPKSPLHTKPLLRVSNQCNIQQGVKNALSLIWPTVSPNPSLCAPLILNWISETEFWVKQKRIALLFARQGDHSELMPSRVCVLIWRG